MRRLNQSDILSDNCGGRKVCVRWMYEALTIGRFGYLHAPAPAMGHAILYGQHADGAAGLHRCLDPRTPGMYDDLDDTEELETYVSNCNCLCKAALTF
jgi:hypothetical protein